MRTSPDWSRIAGRHRRLGRILRRVEIAIWCMGVVGLPAVWFASTNRVLWSAFGLAGAAFVLIVVRALKRTHAEFGREFAQQLGDHPE